MPATAEPSGRKTIKVHCAVFLSPPHHLRQPSALRARILSKTLAAKKEPAQIADERQSQLKLLIARGKEQGFLTYVEVNDHLPSEIVDPEQIEDIVNMINDMGIPVYEKAPESESLLLTRAGRRRRRSRRRSRRRARHGRRRIRPHHRSGAHVHARDGHGRAADARRRNPHRQAHRGRPRRGAHGAVQLPDDLSSSCCNQYEQVKAGQGRLVDIIVGFIDPNAPDEIAAPVNPKLAAAAAAPRKRRDRGRRRSRGELGRRRGARDRPGSGRSGAPLRVDLRSCTSRCSRRWPRRASRIRRRRSCARSSPASSWS